MGSLHREIADAVTHDGGFLRPFREGPASLGDPVP